MRFVLPEDLRERALDYRLTLRTTDNFPTSLFLNDVQLADRVVANGAAGWSCDVPAKYLLETNELNIINVSTLTSKYYGIDYIRLSVQEPRSGTLMLLR